MSVFNRYLPAYTEVNKEQAEKLSSPSIDFHAVEIKPPWKGEVPATVTGFVRSILELQTRVLSLKNTSPRIAYEINRVRNDQTRLQFCVPNTRLERKIRTHLSTEISGIGFETGDTTLPVTSGDSIGGGILTTSKPDRYPLKSEFDTPPINNLVAALHRHAMRDTRVMIQILFQPVVGRSIREWWRKRQADKAAKHLRKNDRQSSRSRPATPRERKQADKIEEKMDQRRLWVTIRFAVIGAKEYTPSRVKEIAGAFNKLENKVSGQYFDMDTIRGLRQKWFLEFFQAIRDREFGGYSLRFQATVDELAALISIPDRTQDNIRTAQP